MKKLLKFFAGIAASAAMLFSCTPEEQETILAQIAFDKASYEIGAEGGAVTVKVLATVDWTAALAAATSLDNIEGITLAAESGKGSKDPIEIVVNFAANDGFDRTVKLSLTGGKVSGSCTITQKGSAVREMEQITIAEFLEKPEDATIYYKLRGVITSIANTTYSNFNLKDIDGDATVYIYGLAYEDDIANQKVELLVKEGIQEGDIITIASTRGSYNGTIEGMNSYYISHEKSATPMIKLDKESYEASATGEVFDLAVTSNIVTWRLSADVDWLTFEPATGDASTTVKVTVAPGEGGTGTITLAAEGLDPVTCVVTRADMAALTIAEFLAKPDDENKGYQIGGIITEIVMDKDDPTKPNKYGNFYIKDHTGTAYIYGLLPDKGGPKGNDAITEKGLKLGDYVILGAPKSSYNDNPQAKNAWYLNHYPAVTNEAFLALDDDATKSVFYTVSGTVTSIVMDKDDATKPNKYGNIYIKDAADVELYLYGVLDWAGQRANFESLGVKVGDVITGYAYKSSYNGNGQAVNLQPVLIEEGTVEPADNWDYTPGAGYLADANLWKPVFDADAEGFTSQAEQEMDLSAVPGLVKKQSTYKFHFADATDANNLWSNYFFIYPKADHKVTLAADKKYELKYTIGADKDMPHAFLKLTAEGAAPKHEGAWTGIEKDIPLTANTPETVTLPIEGKGAFDNICFTLAFGGNPADVNVYIKDIIIVETGTPVLKYEWRNEADTLVNVAFDAAGAQHWYIDADKDVKFDVVVKLNGAPAIGADGSVNPNVTIEKYEAGGGHVAINYVANDQPGEKVWTIEATSTSNVETPVLKAKFVQAPYEYSNLKELNQAIIAAGKDVVVRVINITKPIELTKVEGSNVFAQGKGENFTGGLLLYGTDLEKDTSHGIGWSVTGRVVAETKAFNGVPEVTKIISGTETLKWNKTEGYPCQTKTIKEIKDNYDLYVNVKCNVACRVLDAFSSSDQDGKVADNTGEIAVRVQLKEGITGQPEGANLSQFIVWPSYFNKNQQLGVWADKGTTCASIETSIKMPATLALAVEGTAELKATTNSTGTITYASSDEAVATVSAEGVVTAVAAGTATITASVEKTGLYKAATATCAVTVTSEAPAEPKYVVVWRDDFSKLTGNAELESLSGSDPEFTGSYTGLTKAYALQGALKLATTSASGSVTTPVLTAIQGDNATLRITLKGAGWNKKTSKLQIVTRHGIVEPGDEVQLTSESTMSGTAPTMTGTEYTWTVTGASAETAIQFIAGFALGIDDLVIEQVITE